MKTIYPVILSVPEQDRALKGREMVLNLSKHARSALGISAEKSGIQISDLSKDEDGVPLPFNGNYWSLTHKPKYVGGVVGSAMIGIDIEEIRECSEGLFRKTADATEWDLGDGDRFELFFRYWTSKEAVLKAVGTGIKDLSKAIISKIIDDNNTALIYRDKTWYVEHFFFDGHIASVVKNEILVKWQLIN